MRVSSSTGMNEEEEGKPRRKSEIWKRMEESARQRVRIE